MGAGVSHFSELRNGQKFFRTEWSWLPEPVRRHPHLLPLEWQVCQTHHTNIKLVGDPKVLIGDASGFGSKVDAVRLLPLLVVAPISARDHHAREGDGYDVVTFRTGPVHGLWFFHTYRATRPIHGL